MYYIMKEKNGKEYYYISYVLSAYDTGVNWTQDFDDRTKISSLLEAEEIQNIIHGDKITVWMDEWNFHS